SSNNEVFNIDGIGSITGVISIDPENWIINESGSITGNDITGLESASEREKIYFSPNPSDGVFYIENLNSPAHIIVRDMNGKIRKQTDVLPNELIDIKELGKGSYVIELQISKDIKRLKLITF
ncbi:MAG: T9SS type A sorting domain-containing protein, partial [Flavobacteriales bacterium]|nr:T9SS type A sorting domain-containing protein [Flavobacteriales bacterium]